MKELTFEEIMELVRKQYEWAEGCKRSTIDPYSVAIGMAKAFHLTGAVTTEQAIDIVCEFC